MLLLAMRICEECDSYEVQKFDRYTYINAKRKASIIFTLALTVDDKTSTTYFISTDAALASLLLPLDRGYAIPHIAVSSIAAFLIISLLAIPNHAQYRYR